MKIDHKKFFDGVKERLDPTLNQEQVDGFEFLLTSFEAEPRWNTIPLIAYAFATIWHETAYSMQPVEEGYYLGRRAKAFQKTLRYYPYFGRGYVQLTWATNYEKAGRALGLDLKNKPELALKPNTAFKVLTEGLFRGWFGGKLTAYINAQKKDYVNARRCVNVLDKAGLIAGIATSFEKILRNSATSTKPASDSEPQITSDVSPDPSESLPIETTTVEASDGSSAVVEQTADTIINEESLIDKATKLGDKYQAFKGVLDNFGFSIENAKRSLGTILLTSFKAITGVIMAVGGVMFNNWELFVIAGLLIILAFLLWERSGKRVADAKAGIPTDVAKAMIEKM